MIQDIIFGSFQSNTHTNHMEQAHNLNLWWWLRNYDGFEVSTLLVAKMLRFMLFGQLVRS